MEKKILIAVPCMDQVSARFTACLATLNKVGNSALSLKTSSLIYDSRNSLAEQALKANADYVLWLDSDMVFEPDTLERLLADDKDMVGALYFRRAVPFTPVIYSDYKGNIEDGLIWTPQKEYPQSLFEVAGIGFGCVLMKTDILFNMIAKFKDWFTPLGHSGEDLSFCYRAKELGYSIWCDPTIKMGHEAKMVITEEFYKMYEENADVSKSKNALF